MKYPPVRIGQRYGSRVVIDRAKSLEYNRSARRWTVVCDCGDVRVVFDANLKQGLAGRCQRCAVNSKAVAA